MVYADLLQKDQHQQQVEEEQRNSNKNYLFRRRQVQPLDRQQQTSKSERRMQICSCAAWTFFFLAIICIFISILLIALHPSVEEAIYKTVVLSNSSPTSEVSEPRSIHKTTSAPSKPPATKSIGFFATVVLLSAIGIVFLMFTCCVTTTDSGCWEKTTRNLRLILYSTFTTLPTLGERLRSAQAGYDIVMDFNEDADLLLMDSSDNTEKDRTR